MRRLRGTGPSCHDFDPTGSDDPSYGLSINGRGARGRATGLSFLGCDMDPGVGCDVVDDLGHRAPFIEPLGPSTWKPTGESFPHGLVVPGSSPLDTSVAAR